ncbi:hypothetical protein [Salinibaculum rarum]|uniref:hypothetical protein n=1 Tax=Salinibaculum rarum TaxID=3058903 RepID=UPI00265E72A1|nr:hypothetical protein [Salinibaculum sp. KK48]
MSKSNSNSTQISLGDVSYNDEYTLPEVDDTRIIETIETSDDLYDCSRGDVLWIKGVEYVVLDRSFGFFHNPLLAVGEDGTQGRLIGGVIKQQSDIAGVAWGDTIPDDADEMSSEHLITRFKHVEKLDENRLDLIHKWTPDASSRECPNCGKSSGKPIRIERQANTAIEIRFCRTGCHHLYRYVRDFPSGDEKTVLLERGSKGASPKPRQIAGVFRAEEQDDFKFPLDTHDGRDDGFWTASEIADFLNPKMCGVDRQGVVSIEEQKRRPGRKIEWKDAPGYKADMRITFREVIDRPAKGAQYQDALRRFPSDTAWKLLDNPEMNLWDIEYLNIPDRLRYEIALHRLNSDTLTHVLNLP